MSLTNRTIQSISKIAALATLLCAGWVSAEVRLENSLKKVERYVNAQGEVQHRLVEAGSIVPGDELKYVVKFVNQGDQTVDAGTIVITDHIPEHTVYLPGTAFGSGTSISYSLDGELFGNPEELESADGELATATDYSAIRWVFAPSLEPGESSYVSFNVRLK